MCESTSDCDSGELCGEGVCWGNPPARIFSAELLPPSEGWPGLVPTEIPELRILDDGTIEGLVFAPTATIRGRLVLYCEGDIGCESQVPVEAQIEFARPSSIAGRADVRRVTTSVASVGPDEPSFVITVPVSAEPYTVTITPTSTAQLSEPPDAVAWAPPARFSFEAQSDQEVLWALGRPSAHKEVQGRVVNALGAGIAGMQVYARPSGASDGERSSSISLTDTSGTFTLRIPRADDDVVDIVAAPREEGALPTVVLGGIDIPDPPFGTSAPIVLERAIAMPSFLEPQPFFLPVRGIDGSGNEVPVSGASVRITTEWPADETGITALFSTRATTGDDGTAELRLIPGSEVRNREYILTVEAPAGSQHASIYHRSINISSSTSVQTVLETIVLERRVALGGAIYDAAGRPAERTTVTATLSQRVRDELPRSERAQVQSTAATANASGRFLLWLEESVFDRHAVYDIELAPAGTLFPYWSVHEIDMRTSQGGSIELGEIYVPEASYARGVIVSADGVPVPRAKLRLYEPGTAGFGGAPIFRGVWDSNSTTGEVRLALPDPAGP